MTRKPELVVWGAVIAGLKDCLESEAPMVTLAESLRNLRKNGWQPRDVRMVEQCTLELLLWKREEGMRESNELADGPPVSSFCSPTGRLTVFA